MAKLIESEKLIYIKGGTEGTDEYLGAASLYGTGGYKGDAANGIIFTKDGWIVGRGIEYYIGTAKPGSLNANSGIISDNGTLKITDANGNLLTKTLDLSTIVEKGIQVANGKIGHTHNITAASKVGASADASTSISVPYFSFDANGHITASGTHTATLNSVVDAAMAASKTMYLLGHEEQGKTAGTLSISTVKVETATDGTATLYAPKLNISGGTDGITVGSETLTSYITSKVAEAKTQAMMFKGTIDASKSDALSSITEVSNGDTYKVATGGTISVNNTNTLLKVGDVLIAKVSKNETTTTVFWELIPAGDEKETFITVSSSDLSSKSYSDASGTVTLGNAALRIVGSVADGNTGLVTGDAVYDAITAHLGIDKVGTVTTVGVADNGGLQILDVKAETDEKKYGTSDQAVTAYFRNALTDYTLNAASSSKAAKGGRLYAIELDNDGNLAVNIPQVYSLIVGSAVTDTVNTAKASATGTVYFNLIDSASSKPAVAGSFGITASTGLKIAASDSGLATLTADIYSVSYTATVTSSTANSYKIGEISINDTSTEIYGIDRDTWRDVLVSTINNGAQLAAASISLKALKFSNSFALNSSDEIDLVWAEVKADGTITYTV